MGQRRVALQALRITDRQHSHRPTGPVRQPAIK
jgi:hypothetical protein